MCTYMYIYIYICTYIYIYIYIYCEWDSHQQLKVSPDLALVVFSKQQNGGLAHFAQGTKAIEPSTTNGMCRPRHL